MKNKLNRIFATILLVSCSFLISLIESCKQEHITYSTTSDVNMYTYLSQNSDQFSLFAQIVDKAGYSSFLNTYGAYTLFATNNDGVRAYLKSQGKAGVDNIDVATAKKIVGISLIKDTIGTQLFTDGKMRTPTTSGQYLITGVVNANGVSSITINKQANLVKGNVRVGNGLIHVVDNILIAASLTLAQTVEQDPKYSIFSAALKATGFYDTLNVAAVDNPQVSRKYLTLIAQTDDVFKAAGIPDFATLKQKYSTKGNPKDHQDSLYLFVAYHIFPELAYQSDIAASTSHATLAPLEVVTSELVGQTVLLNNDVFNGVLEPGVPLDRLNSDNSANNGVMHSALNNYKIKIRFPSPVYFDVTDQPEIRRSPGVYKGISQQVPFRWGSMAAVDVEPNASNSYLQYNSEPAVPSTADYYYNNDWAQIGNRFRAGTNGSSSIEFTTPVIIKGRYKIWVDYKKTNNQVIPVTFDGAALPNTFNSGDVLIATETEAQAESRGFKSYSESPAVGDNKTVYNNHIGRLLGVVDVQTTDHHKIKFTSTAVSAASVTLILDAIEFRPIDMNQLHPKLGRDGTLKP